MDPKTIATNGLKSACKIFLQDLEALPEEAFCKSFGPSTRTVADIVYEVDLVNDHIGMIMREEEPFQWPEGGFIRAPQDFNSKASILAAFQASADRIIQTCESFTNEDFEKPLLTEDGETNRFERCRFMTLHLWYHSGQLNFIQTLLGDEAWHWK